MGTNNCGNEQEKVSHAAVVNSPAVVPGYHSDAGKEDGVWNDRIPFEALVHTAPVQRRTGDDHRR